ncbi:MAG: hypothetical protein GY862_37105 [Gammaproteobacteria bacterium]|nr:hypothetical protein [Gammaproteobacteria bacterium]
MEKLQLSDMLVALRRELLDAQCKAANENLKFSVEELEVEVQYTTSTEGVVKGGVRFWVYNAEAGGKIASQTVHKLKLKMKPELSDGDEVLKISDRTSRPK